MTEVLVDTSALYAALDADDLRYPAATQGWQRLLDEIEQGVTGAVTHSGVVVEAAALVQHSLGMTAATALHRELLPLMRIVWVDQTLHERAVAALLAAGRRDVSLVDWTSFELARQHALEVAFAFDDDFWAQGLTSWS